MSPAPGAPLFSIVIPTYNRARSAAAAVRSVLAQTDGDFECFVVDDGSTDDTRQALSGFSDPRLRLVFNEKNRGQHACRNQAIRAAQGEWICFLDSDDLFLPERLARLRGAIAREASVGFWFTNAYVHRCGRIVGKLFEPDCEIPTGRVPGYYAVGDAFLPYVTTMVCLRRSAFEKTGYFREDMRILEDTELYARMLGGGLAVGVVRKPLAVRFLHEGQITRDHRKDFEESMDALRAAQAPPDVAAAVRRRVALEVASYLWKDLQPQAARALLLAELGESAKSAPLYYQTFVPAPLLRPARALRRLGLAVRYSRLLAPAEFRQAAETIAPFLAS